jgi:amidase
VREDEYIEHDATALAGLVAEGQVTPGELLDLAIARLEAVNPRINAVVRRMFEPARAAIEAGLPDGPFRGVPLLLKDLGAHYAGVPTSSASRFLQGFVPDEDAEIVARYKRAGLVIFGKTNTPELGIVGITEPDLFGPTRNPWALEYSTGGSSGGSAAAVAAGIAPVAHAGDGGGSIRIPASACGLVGLKPGRGRSPVGPDGDSGWSGFVEQHVLCKTVRDSAALLDAIAAPESGRATHAPAPERPFSQEVGRDPGRLRIAFTTESLLTPATHPDCITAVERSVTRLESLGHYVEEARPEFDRAVMTRAWLLHVAANVHAEVELAQRRAGRAANYSDFEPVTWLFHTIGGRVSAGELQILAAEITATRWSLHRFFRRFDVLVTPTLARPPVKIGELAPKPAERALIRVLRRAPLRMLLDRALDEMAKGMLAAMPNTELVNMTGQPAVSLPLAWNDADLPIGVQLVGQLHGEAVLIRLAAQLEEAMPWKHRRPAAL